MVTTVDNGGALMQPWCTRTGQLVLVEHEPRLLQPREGPVRLLLALGSQNGVTHVTACEGPQARALKVEDACVPSPGSRQGIASTTVSTALYSRFVCLSPDEACRVYLSPLRGHQRHHPLTIGIPPPTEHEGRVQLVAVPQRQRDEAWLRDPSHPFTTPRAIDRNNHSPHRAQ